MSHSSPFHPHRRRVLTLLGLAAFSASGHHVFAQTGHGHGADGTGHDEVNMPGLLGANASARESAEIEKMFRNFRAINRSVENLPNGIRTITGSNDPELMQVIASHVTGMIARVEAGDDPKILVQSPTLDIIFERGHLIDTDIEITGPGIVVTQTSADAELVAALQKHAGEVTRMADRGMAALHEMMMEQAGRS